ncbi:hypothetical protein MHYP_G00185620 [Metynnis hypsauchen]
MLQVTPSRVTWEMMPQNGVVPTAREGHTLCVVKGKLYLFGGSCHPQATECLPGVYCFDIVTLRWEKLVTGGVSLRTLRHSSAALGDNIYVYGGMVDGTPTDNLMMFNAETLVWQKSEVKGESPLSCSRQTFTAHHDKDIYLFGGTITGPEGTVSSTNEIHKLSVAKMKWKVPLYVGIPPARRYGHTAFILYSHMYVFGGKNEEQEFNDLKIMKLINPSERQPVMKEILSEFGLQGVSNSFVPTKVPHVKYELSETPLTVKIERTESTQPTAHRDFTAVRDEAMSMIHKAFAILDEEFHKLDREKSELSQAAEALRCEQQAYNEYHQKQTQELQEMLERHRSQNEAWLRARAEENDKERKELCKLREEVLHEQEKLKEEQCNIQKRRRLGPLRQDAANGGALFCRAREKGRGRQGRLLLIKRRTKGGEREREQERNNFPHSMLKQISNKKRVFEALPQK